MLNIDGGTPETREPLVIFGQGLDRMDQTEYLGFLAQLSSLGIEYDTLSSFDSSSLDVHISGMGTVTPLRRERTFDIEDDLLLSKQTFMEAEARLGLKPGAATRTWNALARPGRLHRSAIAVKARGEKISSMQKKRGLEASEWKRHLAPQDELVSLAALDFAVKSGLLRNLEDCGDVCIAVAEDVVEELEKLLVPPVSKLDAVE